MTTTVIDLSVERSVMLNLGRVGENGVTEFVFDYANWTEEFGEGVLSLVLKRQGDAEGYPKSMTVESGQSTWVVDSTDVGVEGIGEAQLTYTVNGDAKKSVIYLTRTCPSIEPVGPAPDPYQSWLDQMIEAKEDAENAADRAETAAENLDTKGYYPDMRVGTADNLLSSSYVSDSEPYLLRRTPYGARERGSIVGGSIVWNQLIENGDFADGSSKWVGNSMSMTYDANKATATITSSVATNALRQTKATVKDHVYFATMTITPSKATTVAFYIGNAVVGQKGVQTSRTTVNVVCKATNDGTYIYFYCNRGTTLAVNDTCVYENMQAIDLTLMFGSAIADYIYAQEQAAAGAGVALAKAWAGVVNDYYPYDAGSIKSVTELTTHRMTGFNQWDEEWENGAYASGSGTKGTNANKVRNKNPIPILPNMEYYIETPLSGTNVYQYDADMNYIQKTVLEVAQGNTFTSLPNACYMNFSTFGSDYKVYNNDICINLSDPSKNGTYEPYTVHTYPLDSSLTLRGLPKLDGDSIYYDGDIYPPSGEVERRYGVRAYQSGDESDANVLTDGTNTVYKLTNATTEQAEPYTALQACDPNGTEEWVGASMPVGHDTKYYADLKGKIESIPDAPSADGTYTLKVTVSNGVATYSWE